MIDPTTLLRCLLHRLTAVFSLSLFLSSLPSSSFLSSSSSFLSSSSSFLSGARNRGGASSSSSTITTGTRIRTQCQALVTALKECSPHYVRCIKSNDQKQALSMDVQRVQHQVKYLGLCENIKVRRAGFAYRAEFYRFLQRFSVLCTDTFPEWIGEDKEGCRKIVQAVSSIGTISTHPLNLSYERGYVLSEKTICSIVLWQ